MTEENLVTLKVDGKEVTVPAGTLVIRAAEKLGIHIPRFCDHPLLKPVAACRQCLVEVAMPDREGVVRPMPRPQPSCAMTVMPNMEVTTQLASETVQKAQQGVMEFMLLNHPLDCPICDKAGQCPLQDHSYQVGRTQSRFIEQKRIKEKPVSLTNQILLDRERCILCQRCVRFAKEIAGDSFIDLQLRGTREEIGRFAPEADGSFHRNTNFSSNANSDEFDYIENGSIDCVTRSGENFASYFSGNIIDICPVGALTSQNYRFKARPFDLVSHETISDFDASGTSIKVDIRNNKVLRVNAGENPNINENWINDKERFGYTWQNDNKRIHKPLVDGKESTWGNAFKKISEYLDTKVALLPGGSLTIEDAYAWSKFARTVVKTNAIDFRYRHYGINEENFIYNFANEDNENKANYSDIEKAQNIVLLDFEPEEECTSIFLKLYKSVQNKGAKVYAINPFQSASSIKLKAEILPYKVGEQKELLLDICKDKKYEALFNKLSEEQTLILVGEKAVDYLIEVREFTNKINAKMAFIPRRINEGAGYSYGLTPNLLPNKISVEDIEACQELSSIWNTTLPIDKYSGYEQILDKVIAGKIQTLIIGGVDIQDYPNQEKLHKALEKAKVISLEVRESEITKLANIVLPVAPPSEKNGTYLNWCEEKMPFGQLFTSMAMSDREVLSTIAELKGIDLKLQTLNKVHEEIGKIEQILKTVKTLEYKITEPIEFDYKDNKLPENVLKLSTYKTLLDDGVKISGNIKLQNSAKISVARISAKTATNLGLQTGHVIEIFAYKNGEKLDSLNKIALPVQITQMEDNMIWIPQNAYDCKVYKTLQIDNGSHVVIFKSNSINQITGLGAKNA